MSTLKIVFAALALLAASCSAKAMGPPEIVVDHTACSHCGMLVSELVYAAAYQAADHEPRVFDDIDCMLKAARQETASPITIWLQDAAGAGWIDADEAFVVAAADIRSPMGGGLLAYRDAGAAHKAADARHGRVIGSRQELIDWKGGAK
jgi:nitrous oxide reductase accessory protein NosL